MRTAVISQCSIRHLYAIPSTVPASEKTACIELAKTFERRRCNHHTLENPLTTLECYKDMIDPKASLTNKNHYVVASQEEEVRRWCRTVKGVPSIYVKRSVMVMEPMADASLGVKYKLERGKLRDGLKQMGGKRKREITSEDQERGLESNVAIEEDGQKRRKPRWPKEPNPLSVKKPKKELAKCSDSTPKPSDGDTNKITSQKDAVLEVPLNSVQDLSSKKRRRKKHKPVQVATEGVDDSGTNGA
ncbi:MAG: hypothetical protein MMC33_002818 [Icmadophila ericetorum]|nr:hypothetical protein [Icmadophila ericetorum]